MSGFESPNYTQAPNDFFQMLPEMSDAEIRVTLVMIRLTFGFHRNGFKLGVGKLATASGLSRQGALDGAKAAEERGTFRRANPNGQTEAEWELVVPLQPVDTPLNSVDTPLQPVEDTPLPSGGQVGVKEREINTERKNKKDMCDMYLELSQAPGIKREARINAILSILGSRLQVNPSGKRKDWERFAKYVDDRQQSDGENLDTFIEWLTHQKGFDLQYWPPDKMMTMWPQAFKDGKSLVYGRVKAKIDELRSHAEVDE